MDQPRREIAYPRGRGNGRSAPGHSDRVKEWEIRYNTGMNEPFSNLPGITLGPGVWVDKSHLQFGFSRSSGPGGQNVNKVNSKTELRVHPADLHGLSTRAQARLLALAGRRIAGDGRIVLVSGSARTQEANRRACVEKLRELIEQALVEPIARRKSRPTAGSKRRRLEKKKARGKIKQQRRETHVDG